MRHTTTWISFAITLIVVAIITPLGAHMVNGSAIISQTPTPTPIPHNAADGSAEPPGLFYSHNVEDTFKIDLSLPDNYDSMRPEPYPVIYLLDADWYFDGSHTRMTMPGGVAEMVRDYTAQGTIPPAIVVGIGYPGSNERGRDFHQDTTAFYAFLKYELIPFIDSTYNTLDTPTGRTLLGHSSGGHFAFMAFFWYESPFGNAVAVSGMFTHSQAGIPMMQRLISAEKGAYERIAVGYGSLDGHKLYLAVGSDEEVRFLTGHDQMTEQLASRDYEGFTFNEVVIGSTHHGTVVVPGFGGGLRWIFEDEQ